jgi:VanZ family protein
MDRPSPRPQRTQALMRALGLLFICGVVFTTLYPFTSWKLHADGPLSFLAGGLPRYWTGFDVASNLLAYGVLALVCSLGWASRLAPVVGFAVVAAAGSMLSLGLESAQSFLPNRVPSLLDWLANSAGALAGAWLGALLNRAAPHRVRALDDDTERWYEQGPAGGWVLLLLWLAAQLVPQRLMFATGHLQPALQRLIDRLGLTDAPDLSRLADRVWGGPAPAGYGVAIEAAVVLCALCVVGSLAFALVQGPRRRLVVLAGIVLVAFGLRSIATQTVYGPHAPFAWLTPGVQGGLVVGAVLLYGLETLGPGTRAACAALAAAAGMVLVNIAPADQYFETTLYGVQVGQLENLHGLLRAMSIGWPLAAIGWFSWHAARGPRGRPA